MQNIPKIELHAHISGCMRSKSLNDLLLLNNLKNGGDLPYNFTLEEVESYNEETWENCMEKFTLIAAVSGNVNVAKRLFEEVIEDFADDGIVYCEFRIGLKGKTVEERRHYLSQLVEAAERTCNDRIVSKILVSVARHGNDYRFVKENIELACEFIDNYKNNNHNNNDNHDNNNNNNNNHGPVVVGIELGGNPYIGDWKKFEPYFINARAKGLKISLHIGESPEKQSEWKEMIQFSPDRVGHATFLSDELLQLLVEKKIPVEFCLTVAKRWMSIKNDDDLVFNKLTKIDPNHPIIICVDNTTINGITLSSEYSEANRLLNLDHSYLLNLSKLSINHAFCNEAVKQLLLQKIYNYNNNSVSSL